MAIHYILANLLADADRAVGVLFLDASGETVDYACADFSPYQVRVVGAYVGIYLSQLGRLAEQYELGTPHAIHIEKDELHVHAEGLPDGYYVVLLQRRPGLTAPAREGLKRAKLELERELFGPA